MLILLTRPSPDAEEVKDRQIQPWGEVLEEDRTAGIGIQVIRIHEV